MEKTCFHCKHKYFKLVMDRSAEWGPLFCEEKVVPDANDWRSMGRLLKSELDDPASVCVKWESDGYAEKHGDVSE